VEFTCEDIGIHNYYALIIDEFGVFARVAFLVEVIDIGLPSNCPCAVIDRTIQTDLIPTGLYQVIENLVIQGGETDDNVQLKAGTSITLNGVFEIKQGNLFEAQIEDCDDTNSNASFGCTDPNSHNYDPDATMNNQNCETCDDDILNGDEVMVDCGGSLCDECEACTFGIIERISYINGHAHGAATDGDRYYLIDGADQEIEVYSLSGNLLYEFGSSDVFSFNSPQGIAYNDGRLYIGDNGNDRIAVYDVSGSFITEFTAGGLDQPRWLVYYDNSIIVGQWLGGIIRYDLSGNVMNSINTTGGFVGALTVYNNEIYAAIGQHTINVYSLTGTLNRSISVESMINSGIAIFDEFLITADHNNGRILVNDLEGNLLNTINEGSGWAMIVEDNQLVRFSSSEIEIYGCISE